MNPTEAVAFVERYGVVLQAARGPVPSLANTIAGETIRGSWWGHPKSREIFRAARAVCECPEVLVCKLIDNKVTYVHRRVWSALIKLAPRLGKERLAKVWDEHTKTGMHVSQHVPFPQWVPADVIKEAGRLSKPEAERMLSAVLPEKSAKPRENSKTRVDPHLNPLPTQGEANRSAPR